MELKRDSRGVFVSRLVSNLRVTRDTFLLTLERPPAFGDALPGQFVSVRVSDSTSPLLMRPFSIMSLSEEGIGLLVKVVGPGSKALSEKREGDRVQFVGPLGGGSFPEPGTDEVVMVAGGTGIAPMIFAISRWIARSRTSRFSLLYGGNTEEDVIKSLPGMGDVEVHFSTVDGSLGFRGDVVELCRMLVLKGRIGGGVCYSCGPKKMVVALNDFASDHFSGHYTSLESVMACGVGACRGCTVPVKEGGSAVFRTVCTDGPVFRADEIDWKRWNW